MRWRTALLAVILLGACSFGVMVPEAHAWNLQVTPGSRTTVPGGTVTFSVSVFYDMAEPPLPPVSLLVSPPQLGITTNFAPNGGVVPFGSVMTAHVDPGLAPGVYALDVWAHPDGALFPGPGNKAMAVQVVVQAAAPATDWALSNSGLSPALPNAGDPVTFTVTLVALSTNQPYPQSVDIVARLDGAVISGGTVGYPGPTGIPATVGSAPAWPATAGTHTITWFVASGSDPNPGNNEVSRTFTVGPPPAAFDFEIIASPSSQTVAPGSSTSCSVTVNLLSGTTKNVALTFSGQPAGVTGAFSTSSGNPTFSSSLSLSVSSSTSPGTYSITITGTGGGKTRTATFTLVVGQAKDFRLDVSPASLTVTQGQVATYSITVVGLNGFNSQVSLSATGLPAAANGVFSITSGTPDFTSALTVSLPSNVQTGSFTITIKGSGGGLERYANIILVINPGVTQTQTPTRTATQTQTETTTQTPDFLDILQQNSLLLLGGLLALIVIGALLALRRRPKYPPPPPANPCPTCGKPLTFVKEYDRWYCHNCKEYR